MNKKYKGSPISYRDGRLVHRPVGFIVKRKQKQYFKKQNEKFEVNFPGWQFISNSQYPLWVRILWVIFILLGILMCLGHLVFQLRSFLSQPTMINISVSQTAEIKLPDIVFCPAQLFENGKFELSLLNLLEFGSISTKKGESLLDSIWRQVRLPKEEMVKPSCGLELLVSGKLLNSCEDIPVEVEEILSALGTCYKYHFTESLPYVGVYTLVYFRLPALKNESRIASNQQFELFFTIYDSDTELTPYSLVRNVQAVEYGQITVPFIRSKEFKYLNRRTKKCETDTTIIAGCIQRCTEVMIDKTVKCKLPFMNSTKPDCGNIDLIKETALSIIPILLNKEIIQCEIQCTRPCKEVIYEMRVVTLPSINLDAIDVVFRFEDNSREIIQEVLSYDALQFISDIGGVFGLCIGVCILSLLEIFHIFIMYIKQKCTKR